MDMPHPVIEIEHLSKTYRLGTVSVDALRDVSLAIRPGEFLAVMGPSGSGKSTLMNILGCLDRPTTGVYRLDGHEVEARGRDALAMIRSRKIGFVFQGFNLLPRMTALENVELPLIYRGVRVDERRQRAGRALADVGLAGWEHHTPSELSGGQQQRVAIARAIVTEPSLLLADEPTGNLDTARSIEIMELLTSFNKDQGITIIMVTHEQEMAQFAGRVVHFRDGRVLADNVNGEKR
jgi:putative ABC transport system ATP-binding protein